MYISIKILKKPLIHMEVLLNETYYSLVCPQVSLLFVKEQSAFHHYINNIVHELLYLKKH